MHRHARPGPGVDVAVMHGVDVPVNEWLMQKQVNDVKVKALPKRQYREQQNEPHRLHSKAERADIVVRVHPAQETLEQRQDRRTKDHRVLHVVPGLIAVLIQRILALHIRSGIVFQQFALPVYAVEPRMQPASGDQQQNPDANEHG